MNQILDSNHRNRIFEKSSTLTKFRTQKRLRWSMAATSHLVTQSSHHKQALYKATNVQNLGAPDL